MEAIADKQSQMNWVTAVIAALLILVALIHGCRHEFGAHLGLGAVRVTGADILILLAFIIWLAHCIWNHHLRMLCEVPFAVCFLLLWVILSAIPQFKDPSVGIAASKFAALREFAKLFEIFVAAYLLYAVFARRDWMLRAVMLALFVGASASVLWACYQYESAQVDAMQISGIFSNRNTFSAYLALILPLLLGYSLWSPKLLWRLWAGLLILASLFVVSSGGQFIAMVIGVVVVSFLFRRWLAISIGAIVILFLALVFPHLPRQNNMLLFESIAPYRTEDLAGALKGAVKKAREESSVRIENMDALNAAVAAAPNEAPTRESVALLPSTEHFDWPWQQRYQEWQAAGNMILASPIFGVGAGSYQANVNKFYHYPFGIELPPKYPGLNLMEEDALSMVPVWGSSLGLPALLFILLIVIHFFIRAAKAFHNSRAHWRGIAAGGLGALTAFCIASAFTDYLVGGMGITFAITLGLIAASWARLPRPALQAKEAGHASASNSAPIPSEGKP